MKYTLDQLIACAQEEVRDREAFLSAIKNSSPSYGEYKEDVAIMVAVAEYLIRAKNSPVTAL
ncbi:MAG: hypothetical protein JKY45_03245 [Emcibacter sp.]|nr:hypothetical protein [Emcibacter sp.]